MDRAREEMMLIPEAVSPDGLRARAGIMRERGDESCARHIELAAQALEQKEALLGQAAEKLGEAADTIIKLKARRRSNPLEDPNLEAVSYSTATQDEDKKLRLTLYKSPNQQDPLGYMILTCEQIYDVSMHLMRNYDRLEGIE